MIKELFQQNFFLMIMAFGIAMAWAPVLINFLYKKKVVRKIENDFSTVIEERKQKQGTPIMGGLLIVGTITFVCGILLVINEYEKWSGVEILPLELSIESKMAVPLIVMLLSSLLGGLDDLLNIFGKKRIVRSVSKHIKLAKVHKSKFKRVVYWITLPFNVYQNLWYSFGSYPGKGIHAGEKIIFQLLTGLIAAVWIYFWLGLRSIWVPFYGNLNLGFMMIPFVILVVTAMQNAVNISDGMDGLSSGLLISNFLAFALISIILKEPEASYLSSITIGALLAYLYFNIKPARVEMGDVGSLALGALLATYAFVINRALLLPILGFLFVAEVASSALQTTSRLLLGRRIFKMAPLHLHFQIIGWSEEKIVMRAWLFSIIFAIIGVWLGLQ